MQKQKDLLSLQNLIKRNPDSYTSEFEANLIFFKSLFESFQLSLSKYDKELSGQVLFISQVSHCYPKLLANFPEQLSTILKQNAAQMDAEMRLIFCKALILLRNKGLASPQDVLQLFIRLFKCPDKLLRKTLANYIVQDIKNVNSKHKNARLNTNLQNYMYSVLQENTISAKKCLDIMVELYRRQIWNDAKTVNVVSTCCFSKNSRILTTALKFFLGCENAHKDEKGSDSESEMDEKTLNEEAKKAKLAQRVSGKTKKRKKRLDRQLEALKKHKKKKKPEIFNNSAIHLLHDPQTFAEKLLKQVEHSTERFETRLLMLDLISRLIGIHVLQVLGFYPFIQRYLAPKQIEVTRLLLFCAQASHNLVPPESLEPLVKTIADNFVTDRASPEAIAVGLNSLREIVARAPYALGEDLLSDLVEYRSYRDKNVSCAARGLISLYRQVNPQLLHKRNRGRPTEADSERIVTEFGEIATKDYLPGAEKLNIESDDDEGEEDAQSEAESADDWVDIDQSDDEAADNEDKEETELDPEEAKEKARLITSTKILSQKDFERIERAQVLKRVNLMSKNQKRQISSISVDEKEKDSGELASLSDITRLTKRPKMSKQERLESVAEGRDDKDKYRYHQRRMNPQASTTNQEKRKKKPFGMVKHKAKAKAASRSFKDKQVAFRDALVKRLRKGKR